MDQRQKQRDLMAFADGELDGEAKVELLRRLAEQQDDARALMHQQQLRDAVVQSMTGATPVLPDDLRQRITEMAQPEAPAKAVAQADTAPIGRLGFVGRWMPAAVAAMLLIGAVAVLNIMMRLDDPTTRSATGPIAASSVVDMHLVGDETLQRFARRHEQCTTTPGSLMEADWPDDLELLPAALSDYLGAQANGVLDLSELGYRFTGAGPCHVPGDGAAHLIYHRIDGERRESISLWMCPDDGRYDISPRQIYRVSDPDAAHPVMLWRDSGVIYYLVGDAPLDTRKACDQLIARRR